MKFGFGYDTQFFKKRTPIDDGDDGGGGGPLSRYGAHTHWRLLNGAASWYCISSLRFYDAEGGTLFPTVGGIPTASSGVVPTSVFDSDDATWWESGPAGTNWVAYEFTTGVDVGYIEYVSGLFGGEDPLNPIVQFSDDGDNWTTAWNTNLPRIGAFKLSVSASPDPLH